jgi:radical SAM protein with 4Fe4S-binding SPASM domain
LHYIVYSIDGGTAATFERLRCGATFDKVWSNLAEVAAMRAQVGSKVTLRIEFVAMRSNNVRELPEVLRLAEAAGVDMVKVSHLVVWDEALRDESLFTIRIFAAKPLPWRERLHTANAWPLICQKPLARLEPVFTPMPHAGYYAMISYEGDVRACCFAPELTMGSLRDSSFSSIWMQERYQRLRELMASGKAPVACQRCENRFRYHASPDEERTYVKLTPRQK